jgi:hypothetical protein
MAAAVSWLLSVLRRVGMNPNGRYWNPYPYGNGWSMVSRELWPARVSGFAPRAPRYRNNNLTWTNPTDSSFNATYIVYKTMRLSDEPDRRHLRGRCRRLARRSGKLYARPAVRPSHTTPHSLTTT